ncbi:MAG: hypothetical protein HGB30_12680 [Holophagaceae bacterium]|nr:hypothetical protein [Holophagaceae bacterium]
MRKMLAIALVSTFAFVAFAEDKKPEPKKATACEKECCKKSQADCCKDSSDCGKKAGTKKEAPKKG